MFVSFEGPEGAGKSTVLAEVATRLRATGRKVVTTREPGSGEFGMKIRELLLHGADMTPPAELFLFLADRAQHVATVIQPALNEGKLVLCDRYVDSTFVYQSVTRGLDPDFVSRANRFATDGLMPKTTILFDLDPEIGLARVTKKDRLDGQPLSFHKCVRQGFIDLAKCEPDRWVVIDASQSLGTVIDQVWDIVSRVSGA